MLVSEGLNTVLSTRMGMVQIAMRQMVISAYRLGISWFTFPISRFRCQMSDVRCPTRRNAAKFVPLGAPEAGDSIDGTPRDHKQLDANTGNCG